MYLISERGCKLASSPAPRSVARVLISDRRSVSFRYTAIGPSGRGVQGRIRGDDKTRSDPDSTGTRTSRTSDCRKRPQPITVIGGQDGPHRGSDRRALRKRSQSGFMFCQTRAALVVHVLMEACRMGHEGTHTLPPVTSRSWGLGRKNRATKSPCDAMAYGQCLEHKGSFQIILNVPVR
jgi:hypothetical protein